MNRKMSLAAALFAALASASAFAANPSYDSWASHKPGTTVTMTGTTEANGMKTETEQTYTLKEVTPEKVTIELKSSVNMMGNKTEMPATTMTIPSTAAANGMTPQTPANTPAADAKTSQEKVTIAGKEYDATCTTMNTEANGMKTTAKTWTSPEVPGMTLKMESQSEGQMKMSTKMEVTKIEVK